MSELSNYKDLHIAWNLTPEHAVGMYLEWGNAGWKSEYGPVRSREDESIYFVVDTWNSPPIIRLVRRNIEKAVDITSFPIPDHLMPGFKEENGNLKGISHPTGEIKEWLRKEMGQEMPYYD